MKRCDYNYYSNAQQNLQRGCVAYNWYGSVFVAGYIVTSAFIQLLKREVRVNYHIE